MICDTCGKNNSSDAAECTHCGSTLPPTAFCGGFADVLSFSPGQSPLSQDPQKAGKTDISGDYDMQKLLKKMEDIIRLSRRNLRFSFISILLGLLIFLSSIGLGIFMVCPVQSPEKEGIKAETSEETPEQSAVPATSPTE